MPSSSTLLWFRHDLRLTDHEALRAAIDRAKAGKGQDAGAVIPIFIWAPDEEAPWAPGAARRWWLHHALERLSESLEACGSKLLVRAGPTREVLAELLDETGAGAVYWSRRYEPVVRARDAEIKTWLKEDRGIEAQSFNANLLYEPWTVETKTGGPYRVFTPYWRTVQALPAPEKPLPAPRKIPAPDAWPKSLDLEYLDLRDRIDWAADFPEHWTPGEAGAAKRLKRFLKDAVTTYPKDRDYPAVDGTSGLSAHLVAGEISPRQIWHATHQAIIEARGQNADTVKSAWHFLREIGWREFAYHVMYHYPHTPEEPLQEKYAAFPWVDDAAQLHQWQTGRTGYPMVDAGMRQLWSTGWMHNRVRMIVASFLVKDLRISWLEGARWFWDTLVDADLASNTLGWQWAGGCGADAAPYFRIFNPTTQSQKFDADARYVCQHVPELAGLDPKHVHAPSTAPPLALQSHGLTIDPAAAHVKYAHEEADAVYPPPMVDHKAARDEALEALASIKQKVESKK